MKKIFKGLSAIALASAIGLNVLTVNAAAQKTCEPGEVEYTNYYMFLNEDTADFLSNGVNQSPQGSIFTLYNGADKTNDIANVTVLDKNYVKITDGSKSNTKSESPIVWSVAEFWQNFYKGYDNMKEGYVGEFPEEKQSFYFHKEWWKCADGNFTDCTARDHITAESTKALIEYLKANISSIGSSPLATRATSLPETFITVPNDIGGTTTSSTLRWNVTRKIKSEDLLEGIAIGTGTSKKVWSPAAYYVKYCKSSGEAPEQDKKITYDKNTSDEVTDMPTPNPWPFKAECTNISTSTPKRAGWQFMGWSKNKTDSEGDPKYNPGTEYCEKNDNITLYAIWKRVETNNDGTYTVTYDANGGKDAPSPQTAQNGSCLNISSGKPTLTKNNFLGWSRFKDAKEPDPAYAAGAEYCGADGNITLYAVWQVQTGISAHFIAFSIVAIAAGAALVVAQRKDLFKQI